MSPPKNGTPLLRNFYFIFFFWVGVWTARRKEPPVLMIQLDKTTIYCSTQKRGRRRGITTANHFAGKYLEKTKEIKSSGEGRLLHAIVPQSTSSRGAIVKPENKKNKKIASFYLDMCAWYGVIEGWGKINKKMLSVLIWHTNAAVWKLRFGLIRTDTQPEISPCTVQARKGLFFGCLAGPYRYVRPAVSISSGKSKAFVPQFRVAQQSSDYGPFESEWESSLHSLPNEPWRGDLCVDSRLKSFDRNGSGRTICRRDTMECVSART